MGDKGFYGMEDVYPDMSLPFRSQLQGNSITRWIAFESLSRTTSPKSRLMLSVHIPFTSTTSTLMTVEGFMIYSGTR
jgi:hypothetical protein